MTDNPIKKVWIEDGCISCNLCEDLVPEVFEVPGGGTCRPRKGHKAHLDAGEEMDERLQEAASEVAALMRLLIDFAKKERMELRQNGIRVRVAGQPATPPRG